MWDVERGEAETDPAYRSVVEEGGFGGRLLSNSDWSRPARAHLVSLSLSLTRLLRLPGFSLFLFPRWPYL